MNKINKLCNPFKLNIIIGVIILIWMMLSSLKYISKVLKKRKK